MTGVGGEPRTQADFIVDTRKHITSLERQLSQRGAIDLSQRIVAGSNITIDGVGSPADPMVIRSPSFASQAQVNAGTDGSTVVTPDTLRNRDYAPFAQAAGVTLSGGGSGGSAASWYWDLPTTITFPAGLFTEPPVVSANVNMLGGIMFVDLVNDPTTASFQVRIVRLNATPGANLKIHWHAIQMEA